MDSFWYIYNVLRDEYSYNNPSIKHPSEESALTEATRVATKHPGAEILVLKATHHVQVAVPKPIVTILTKE